MPNTTYDYIVVGGGCIGASTVYALIRECPNARIAWLSGTKECTASSDFMKIIRDTYPETKISEYASRSLRAWMENYPYREHFLKTGWIRAIDSNSKNMNRTRDDSSLTTANMMSLVGSSNEPILDNAEELYLNPEVGYADSVHAVSAVSQEAVKMGVMRYEEDVTKVLVESGKCVGVEVGGIVFKAEKCTIVSAGVWTPGLLKKSSISFPDDFFTVTAVGVATLSLSDKEFEDLKSMPILVTENGEVMLTLSQKKRVLKVTTTKTFQIMDPDHLPTDVDIKLNGTVLDKMLPQFNGRDLKSFVCPDLITPYQDPIIDYAPDVERLVVATGGSYHSFKFLPIIGDMVVLRVRGETGDPVQCSLLKRWSWDRHDGAVSVHPNIVPQSS